MDNTARAHFLNSLGSLNDYGSTVYQTKRALDEGTTSALRQNTDDLAIFTDAQRGIEAIKRIGFSTDGIIAVNRAFTSDSDEEPAIPGHLRNAIDNEDDRITVLIDGNAHNGYFPPEQVTRTDLDTIVNQYNHSKHTESDA